MNLPIPENYVECGPGIAELKPTLELRYIMRYVVLPFPVSYTTEAKSILQQKWQATYTSNGTSHTRFEWRDVPTVTEE